MAARIALDCGVRLIVPLPMDREEYEKDFTTPESVAEFRALLARAASSFVVPAEGSEVLTDRRMLYANCGAAASSCCATPARHSSRKRPRR